MMWSLPSSLGRPLAVASLVRATLTPRLPRRNPTCWPPGSWREGGGERGREGGKVGEGERRRRGEEGEGKKEGEGKGEGEREEDGERERKGDKVGE